MTTTQASEQKLNLESITRGGITWINIQGPTEREIRFLEKTYAFNRYDLDDCLSRTQRPKIDEYKDYLFIVLHFQAFNRKTRISTHTQVSVFIGENYLITLHSGQLKPMVQFFKDCQANEKLSEVYFNKGSSFLLYAMLDRLVDSYFHVLDKIFNLMDSVEDAVFDENIEAAKELSILRRDIITQRRIILPMRTVFTSLEPKLRRFARVDMSVELGDLNDHVSKIVETLDEIKELIEVFKDTDYLLSSDRLNRVVRILTVFSTILLPFLVVSSIYGMNVMLPGGLVGDGAGHTFIVLIIVMAGLAGGMLIFFRRKRWI